MGSNNNIVGRTKSMLSEILSTVYFVDTIMKRSTIKYVIGYYNKDLGTTYVDYVCTRYGKDSIGQLKQLKKFSSIFMLDM